MKGREEILKEINGAQSTNSVLLDELVKQLDDSFQHDHDGETVHDCCILLADVALGRHKDDNDKIVGSTVCAVHGCAEDLVDMFLGIMKESPELEAVIMEAAKRNAMQNLFGGKRRRG